MARQETNRAKEREQELVGILRDLEYSPWYCERGGMVEFYYRDDEGDHLKRRVTVEEFQVAVDYYCQNRENESGIAFAIAGGGGRIKVHSAEAKVMDESTIVIKMSCFKVLMMLEFAHLLSRKRLS